MTPVAIANRQAARKDAANAIAVREDFAFVKNRLAGLQQLEIARRNDAGFRGRMNLRRRFSYHRFARQSPELFTSPVDEDIAAIRRVFYKDCRGNIVDDQV